WSYNSYSGILSLPKLHEYDQIETRLSDAELDMVPLPEYHIAWVPTEHGDTATVQGAKDAAFIAASREIIPELLYEIDALRRELEAQHILWLENREDNQRLQA